MSEASYRRYVLGQLRMAHVRARMLQNEIKAIGTAIKTGLVEPDHALAWLSEALVLVQSEPAATIEWEAANAEAARADATTISGQATSEGIAERGGSDDVAR